MKIMYVSLGLNYAASTGGSAFSGLEVFKRLGQTCQVYFLVTNKFSVDNIKTIILKNNSTVGCSAAEQIAQLTKHQLRQKLPKVDIVICSYWTSWNVAKQIAKAQNTKIISIYRMHNTLRKNQSLELTHEKGIRDDTEQEMAKDSDLIICLSYYEKKIVLDAYCVPATKIRVIPNGVDFKQIKSSRDGILFASRLEKIKGTDDLLKAARRLRKNKFVVCNVGSELENIRQANLNNVELVGWIAHNKLGKVYSSAKALFLPSKAETFGNITLEAMACGLPVVGYTEGAGIHVKNGITGFIVKNPGQAAKKLNLLCSDKELWHKLSSNCAKYAKGFGWEKTASLWEKEIRQLLT